MTSRKIVAALVLLVSLAACQARNDNPVPDHLVGVWKTSEPRYADRYVEIRHDIIIFGTGGETFELHALMDIAETRAGESIVYTITHLNHSGQKYNLAFYYDPSTNGIIRFKNQREVAWTKETD